MLKRSPRNVTLESSPMLIEDILKVEFRFQGEVWIEIDSESGLRICLGETEAWWHPNELHHAGVSRYRITLRDGRVQEFSHDPTVVIATLRMNQV